MRVCVSACVCRRGKRGVFFITFLLWLPPVTVARSGSSGPASALRCFRHEGEQLAGASTPLLKLFLGVSCYNPAFTAVHMDGLAEKALHHYCLEVFSFFFSLRS